MVKRKNVCVLIVNKEKLLPYALDCFVTISPDSHDRQVTCCQQNKFSICLSNSHIASIRREIDRTTTIVQLVFILEFLHDIYHLVTNPDCGTIILIAFLQKGTMVYIFTQNHMDQWIYKTTKKQSHLDVLCTSTLKQYMDYIFVQDLITISKATWYNIYSTKQHAWASACIAVCMHGVVYVTSS